MAGPVDNKPVVALMRCDDYSSVKAAIKRGFELLGGVERFVGKNDKVMLKPNICDPLPAEKASCTHPLLMKAVIEIIKEVTPTICVGEQSASGERGNTKRAVEVSGIGNILKQTGTRFRNLQEEGFIAEDIKGHKVLERTDFSKAVFQQDIIVNLPKFKTHGLCFVTGAVKNCFGLIHPEEKQYMHGEFYHREEFSEGVVDIYSFVMPKLTIMDAVVCMEGDEGPSYGEPIKVGYVIMSADGVAADAVASKITNHNPLGILTTKFAYQRGLGVGDLHKIKIVGDELRVVKDFNQHVSYRNRLTDKQGLQPEISGKCVQCGACFRSCPTGAIKKVEGKYFIDRKKCIRCYCCLEVCVNSAVRLRKDGDKAV